MFERRGFIYKRAGTIAGWREDDESSPWDSHECILCLIPRWVGMYAYRVWSMYGRWQYIPARRPLHRTQNHCILVCALHHGFRHNAGVSSQQQHPSACSNVIHYLPYDNHHFPPFSSMASSAMQHLLAKFKKISFQ